MWQLFLVVVWLLIRSYDCEVSVIGNNVTLECPGTTSTARIVKLLWEYANGTRVFYCERNTCENNTTRHALAKKDKFISFLTIHNVSLDDEAEYGFKMLAIGGLQEDCKRNLTITVSPIGLELVDADGNELLQNNGSLKITEGENKTVFCKTNAPTKPAVDLEWIIPNGLNVSANSSIYLHDDPDKRLSVPLLKLSFTLNVYDDDIVLVCRVASNSSFDEIRASIYIKNEGELATGTNNLRTSSEETHSSTASSGASLVRSFVNSTTSNIIIFSDDFPRPCQCNFKPIWIVYMVAACGFIQVLITVLIFHILKKKQVGGSAAPTTQTSVNLLDDDTSQTTKPKSTGSAKSLDMTFDESEPTNTIPDDPEVPHTYMAMKPIQNCKFPPSTSQQVSYPTVDDHGNAVIYVSPTLVRKQVKAHSNLKEEPTYVNTEAASTYCEINKDIPNIVEDQTEGRDDVFTTYI